MIVEDYCGFETAKLLKEKGFDGECDLFGRTDEPGVIQETCKIAYNQGIDDECVVIPTLQMAMKFLREKECVICVIPLAFYFGEKASSWGYNIWASDNLEVDEDNTPKFTTYEEACEAAIKYCLENLI